MCPACCRIVGTLCDHDEAWASRTGFNRSTKRPRLEHHGSVARSRPDHPVLDFTIGLAVPRVAGSRIRRRTRAGVAVC